MLRLQEDTTILTKDVACSLAAKSVQMMVVDVERERRGERRWRRRATRRQSVTTKNEAVLAGCQLRGWTQFRWALTTPEYYLSEPMTTLSRDRMHR